MSVEHRFKPITLTEFCGLPPHALSVYLREYPDADHSIAFAKFLDSMSDGEFEQLLKDSNFDFYNKVGAPVYSLDEAVALVTKPSNKIPSRLFRGTRGVRTK